MGALTSHETCAAVLPVAVAPFRREESISQISVTLVALPLSVVQGEHFLFTEMTAVVDI